MKIVQSASLSHNNVFKQTPLRRSRVDESDDVFYQRGTAENEEASLHWNWYHWPVLMDHRYVTN